MVLDVLNQKERCSVDDFKGNYINKCMGDSSNGSKTLT